jgi:hypothetical protein
MSSRFTPILVSEACKGLNYFPFEQLFTQRGWSNVVLFKYVILKGAQVLALEEHFGNLSFDSD